MQAPLRMLVTGGGAPGIAGTLAALRRNPRRHPVWIAACDLNPEAVGRWLADDFFTVPAPEDAAYLERLIAACRARDIALIVPQTTREIAVLSQHEAELADAGIRVMVSSANAIATANDKGLLLAEFDRLGLPTPVWHRTADEAELVAAARELGYPDRPVVVKPPVSNGLRGLRILREAAWDQRRFFADKPSGMEASLAELLAILRRGEGWSELLVTEYLPGDEYTVDCFRGESLAVVVPRRRDVVRSGISFVTTVEPRDDLVDISRRAAAALDLRYAFGFQYKLDADGVPKLLESNPRIQGTMVASCMAGANVIWLAVEELCGLPPSAAPTIHPLRFTRYWGGLGVGAEVDGRGAGGDELGRV